MEKAIILMKSKRWPEREVENFFETWNPEMAYVLGYFAADGSIYHNKRGSRYVEFTSTDKDLIQLIVKLMHGKNKIKSRLNKDQQKESFSVQIGSYKLFNSLIGLGFTPTKSLTLKFPDIPEELLNDFIRGYFDGDGCAYVRKLTRKNRDHKMYLTIQASFTCGSETFLEQIQKVLIKLAGMGKGSLYFHSGAYRLLYSAKDVKKLYNFMYPSENISCLIRKRDILKEGLTIRGRSSIG